jgi:hypothetical protein
MAGAHGAPYGYSPRRRGAKLLQRAFGEVGDDAVQGWLKVNQALAGKSLQP